jgi:hypothetical protein
MNGLWWIVVSIFDLEVRLFACHERIFYKISRPAA